MAELLNIEWDNEKPNIEWDDPPTPGNPPVDSQKLADSLVYSEALNVQPEAILNDYDNFNVAKQEHDKSSVFGRIMQSWEIGKKNTQLGYLGWRALNGENVDAEIDKLRSSIPQEFPEEYGIVEKSLRAAAKLLPTSVEVLGRSMKQGLILGGGAAGIAAIGGQVGPQVLLPEEIVTVPAAFAGMYAVGAGPEAFQASMEIEGGHGYLELLDMTDSDGNKIDPLIAKSAAAGIGVINGALEFAQLKLLLKTIPGADKLITGAMNKTIMDAVKNKTVKQIVGKSVAKYGSFITLETSQEVAQESTNIFMGEFAKNLNNALKGTDFEPAERQEMIDRLVDTAKESALAFLVMGLPGSVVQTNQDLYNLVAERNTNGELEDAVNNAVTGQKFVYEGHNAEGAEGGFRFRITDEESPLQGQTINVDTLNPIEIYRKLEDLKEQTDKVDPENQIKVQEDVAKILQEPDMVQEVIEQRDGELDQATELYDINKDIWIGKKDQRVLETQVEKRTLQEQIMGALGEKHYNQRVKEIDAAIHLHMDLKSNPEHLNEYYDELTPEQKKLVDLSQNLPAEVMAIVDQMEKSYKAMGLEALETKVIKNILDNYASRIWDVGKNPTAAMARKFGTETRHAKQRKYGTILQGWVEGGLRLKIAGATNNLQILKEEIIKTIEDKKFLDTLKTLKDTDNQNIFSTIQYDGYERIKHPNFTTWRWREDVTPSDASGKGFGKNYFITEDGQVFERVNYYAPKEIAKNMNKILGISKLANTPGLKTVTKYNAIFKQWILITSLFHHLAFMRSYWFGTNNKKWSELNIRQSYKDGLKSVMNLEPEIMRGVKNGLTLGLRQEWEEALLQEQTIIGKAIDAIPGGEAVKSKILDLKQMQTDFLFGSFGAGLKAKSYLIEFKHHMKKNPTIDPDVLSKQVASLINDDFGGLHLQRLGRDPTLQHIFRLFALAPDWTESNIRTMVKTFTNAEKNKKTSSIEKDLYRRFWFGILWKGAALTGLMNFLLAGGDPEEMERNFKQAWKAGNLRWLEVDITPIYKALGNTGRDRRYFSIWGHFKDPVKFATHTLRSAHHKGSVVYSIGYEALSGADWAGRRFTTLEELMSTGELVGWGKGGPLEKEQYASYVLSQLIGLQPIQIQNLHGWMSGEQEGFDAIGNSLGLGIRRTYEPKQTP